MDSSRTFVESNPPLPPVSSRVTVFLFSSVRAPDKKGRGENTHRGGKKRGKEKRKGKTKDEERGETRKWEGKKKGNVEQEIDDKKKEEEE